MNIKEIYENTVCKQYHVRVHKGTLSPPLRRQSSSCIILLQHGWLLIFFLDIQYCNRFAETHGHFQLSYQITDRLLAAGNEKI